MWMTAFYMPVMPIGIVISIVGLFCDYWMNKYLLLRRYARPNLLGNKLNNSMIEYLEFVPLFMSVGSLVFHILAFKEDATSSDRLPNYIAIVISCVNFVFPSADINKCFFKVDEDVVMADEDDSYDLNRFSFSTEYDRANPVTSAQGI